MGCVTKLSSKEAGEHTSSVKLDNRLSFPRLRASFPRSCLRERLESIALISTDILYPSVKTASRCEQTEIGSDHHIPTVRNIRIHDERSLDLIKGKMKIDLEGLESCYSKINGHRSLYHFFLGGKRVLRRYSRFFVYLAC